jgi:hypothetical protein
MDVLTYIKKMQEVDILKYLLLTPDQLDLFSFMTKPSVLIHEIKNDFYKDFEEEQKRSLSLNRDEIEKIFVAYRNILNKDIITIQDKKLINLFEAEVENLREY